MTPRYRIEWDRGRWSVLKLVGRVRGGERVVKRFDRLYEAEAWVVGQP